MKVTISVTAEHIAKGRQGQCGACPIARAFLEQVPNCSSIDVRYAWIRAIVGGEGYRGETPPTALKFIEQFDEFPMRPAPEPFSFEVAMHKTGWRRR